jgi:hypothetical protein
MIVNTNFNDIILRDFTEEDTDTSNIIIKQSTFDILYSPSVVQPPKLAYLYTPSTLNEIEMNSEDCKKSIRWIFEVPHDKLLQFEKDKLRELKDFLRERKAEFGFTDSYLHRFLQSCEYDIDKCYLWLLNNFEFRQSVMPMNNLNILYNKKTIEILSLGFIYFSGRDNRFRPNIIIKPNILKKNLKRFTLEEWRNAIIFLVEYCVRYMLIPGKVENWNIILDLKDFSLYNLPQDMKTLCIIFQKHYKCRLYRLFFMNMSTFGSILYRLIPTFLGSQFEKKVIVIDEPSDLFNYINRSQIERHYGGYCKEIECYFPPHELSNEYFVGTDNPMEIICKDDIVLKKKKSRNSTDAESTKKTNPTDFGLIYHQPIKRAITTKELLFESERKRGLGCCNNKENNCIII